MTGRSATHSPPSRASAARPCRGLIEARGETPFADLGDLARRMNPRLINKRTLESLVAAGALDELEPDRARANAAVDAMMAMAQRSLETAAGGMDDMFGGVAAAEVALRIPPYEPWPASVRLQKEYAAVGFFLSGHPLDEFGPVLERLRVQKWVDFCRAVKGGVSVGRVAATVLDRYERRTKSGSKMGVVMLSDQTGHFEAIVFQEGLQKYRDLLEPGRALVLVLQAGLEGDEVRARIQIGRVARRGGGAPPEGHAHLPAHRRADPLRPEPPARARRGRGVAGADPRFRRARGRGQAAGPLPGEPADRRRAARRAGRGACRDELRAGSRRLRIGSRSAP